MNDQLPTPITPTERLLTAAEFQRLADVPPEIEWFANIRNRSTRRAYENAMHDFHALHRHCAPRRILHRNPGASDCLAR